MRLWKNMHIKTLNVYKTVSQLLSTRSLFLYHLYWFGKPMSFPNSYVLHTKTKTKHFKAIKTETHSDKIMIKKKQIRKYTNGTCSLILCSAPHNLHVWETVLSGWIEKWMLCFWSKHKCGAITHTVLHVLCIPSALHVSLSNHDSDRWEDSDLFTFGQIHCSSAWHSTHHCQTRQCFKSRHVATCCRRRRTAVWSVFSSLWSFVAFEILFGRLPEVEVAPAHRTLLPSASRKVTFWNIVKRCLLSYPKFEDRWKTCFPLWVNITLTWQPTRADGKK